MTLDREKLAKVAGLLASDKMGERAAAAAKATAILKRAGMIVEPSAPNQVVDLSQDLLAALGIATDRAFVLANRGCGRGCERSSGQVVHLIALPIPAVLCLRVQLLVDCLPPRRLLRPVGRGQFSAAEVFVNHRQLGVQIAVGHDDAGCAAVTKLFASCETMRMGRGAPAPPRAEDSRSPPGRHPLAGRGDSEPTGRPGSERGQPKGSRPTA